MNGRLPIVPRIEPIQFSQRARTREVIVDAARKLYGREGYSAVTMRALAREIGCSAGSLYTYFRDKNEIFSVLQEQGLRLYAESVAGVTADHPADALRQFFLRYYEFSKLHPDYFTLLWVDRAAPKFGPGQTDLRVAIAEGHALAQRCLDHGVFPPGLNPHTITRVLWSAVHGPAVLHQLRHGTPGAEGDELAEATLDLALAGLRSGVLVSSRRTRPCAKPMKVRRAQGKTATKLKRRPPAPAN